MSEQAPLEFEREKWRDEYELRKHEIEPKERDTIARGSAAVPRDPSQFNAARAANRAGSAMAVKVLPICSLGSEALGLNPITC
jgi:hypothetical protein